MVIVLKTIRCNSLQGSNPCPSAKYGGGSLEVKVVACEAIEAGAIPVHHPKSWPHSIWVNTFACHAKETDSSSVEAAI